MHVTSTPAAGHSRSGCCRQCPRNVCAHQYRRRALNTTTPHRPAHYARAREKGPLLSVTNEDSASTWGDTNADLEKNPSQQSSSIVSSGSSTCHLHAIFQLCEHSANRRTHSSTNLKETKRRPVKRSHRHTTCLRLPVHLPLLRFLYRM